MSFARRLRAVQLLKGLTLWLLACLTSKEDMALASARLIEVYLIMAKAVYSSENVQQFDHLRALINLSFVPSHAHRHMEIPPDFHAWEVPAHGVSGYPPK